MLLLLWMTMSLSDGSTFQISLQPWREVTATLNIFIHICQTLYSSSGVLISNRRGLGMIGWSAVDKQQQRGEQQHRGVKGRPAEPAQRRPGGPAWPLPGPPVDSSVVFNCKPLSCIACKARKAPFFWGPKFPNPGPDSNRPSRAARPDSGRPARYMVFVVGIECEDGRAHASNASELAEELKNR